MNERGDAHNGLLRAYHVTVTTPVAWGDMDAFAHVNNTIYFRWFESARIAYFDAIGFSGRDSSAPAGPILAATHCRFRLPLRYPDTVTIGARVSAVGDDRFTMQYCVVSAHHRAIAADGEGVVVSYDYTHARKILLPADVRTRIRQLDGV